MKFVFKQFILKNSNFFCFTFICIEIAGFEGFDILDYNSDPEYENNPPEIGEPEVAVEDFLTYKKNMEDMRNHEQNQLEIVSAFYLCTLANCLIFYFIF